MIKFTRSTKKKLDKVRHTNQPSSSSNGRSRSRGPADGRSVSSAYSTHSTRSDYTDGNSYAANNGGGGNNIDSRSSRRHNKSRGGTSVASSTGGSRRYSSAQSVASISSASVFAPSVATNQRHRDDGLGGRGGGGGGGLQPSSARLLRDLNKSAHSSLLSSLGTAASRTFRSYKMTLPRCPPPIKTGSASSGLNTSALSNDNNTPPVETDLELLGRTVHAVSSALTEPPKEGDRYMIYDVSFNPKGCVWDALIVVQVQDDDDDEEDENNKSDNGRSNSRSSRSNRNRSSRSNTRGSSKTRSKNGRSRSRSISKNGDAGNNSKDGENKTFTFPIKVTCAEDDDVSDNLPPQGKNDPPRAKTYAVDLSVIDDSIHHPISKWSTAEAAEHRDDIKNAMEWVSYGIRRSMARSMFPQFPEGCQGKLFREVYQLNKKLKSGTFSTVCRGVHRATGRQVAVKCILRKKIEPSVDAAVFEEVLIMSGLHHKYICPMIDYFEEDRCHFVVMELEKGGDLCERVNDKGTYSEEDARACIRNVTEAMEFVHTKGFAHCDIKPRNYLLRSKRDDVDVRLADFGFAQHVHAPNSLTSQCGTPFFVAPEVINRKPYDQKVDMWSIGVTCYLLLCGDTPFNGKNRQQLFRRISCDDPAFPDDKWGHISDDGVDFVKKMLSKDPANRLSAEQALKHRWLMTNKPVERQQSRGLEASTELSDKKSRGSSRGRTPKSPPSTNELSREGSKRSTKSDDRNVRSKSRDRERNNRSKSRDRKSANRPPPPPKPQAALSPSSSSGTTAAKRILNSSGQNISDENARLLDIIKAQDAKIEKLERMVKRMLEPDEDVHEC